MPPRKLTKREAKIWEMILRELGASGVLGRSDSLAVAKLCELEALAESAKRCIDRDGLVNSEGERNPNVSIFRDVNAQLLRLYAEFGLTASSRGRIDAGNRDPDAGGIEEFLSS